MSDWDQSKESLGTYLKRKEQEKTEKEGRDLVISGVICIVSMILMILVQSIPPNQEYMNPLGACFAIIWLGSGIYFGMGLLFKL